MNFIIFLINKLQIFVSRDKFNFFIIFFIFFSTFYKNYKKFLIYKINYFTNVDFIDIDNGNFIFKYDQYEEKVKLLNINLPNNDDRCYKNFTQKFKSDLIQNVLINNKIDVYIAKKRYFLVNLGQVFFQNQDILDHIKINLPQYSNLIDLKPGKKIDWCNY